MTALTAAERAKRYRDKKRDGKCVTMAMVRDAIRDAIEEAMPIIVQQVVEIVTSQRDAKIVTLVPLEKKSPTPHKKLNPSPSPVIIPLQGDISPPPKSRKQLGRSIAETWQPDERDRDYARSKKRDDNWIAEQAERFRDHHLKTGKPWCDWHACWRTWVRNAEIYELPLNGKALSNGYDHHTRIPLDSTPDPAAKESALRGLYAQLGIEC